MSFTEELVLDGQFIHKEEPARKIALYTQDADHNITNSFKLTAPKLTIRSENARIQGGTFVGDVYVEADGFAVVNATIEGNVYFSDDKYQATYSAADQGKVTGVTEVKKIMRQGAGCSSSGKRPGRTPLFFLLLPAKKRCWPNEVHPQVRYPSSSAPDALLVRRTGCSGDGAAIPDSVRP
ncbi:hypothetical protein ACFTAO_31560 [Paenibacillus rhizoplanae]